MANKRPRIPRKETIRHDLNHEHQVVWSFEAFGHEFGIGHLLSKPWKELPRQQRRELAKLVKTFAIDAVTNYAKRLVVET